MMDKILGLLARFATGRWVILLFLLIVAVNVLLLPVIYPTFQTLDLQSSYTPDQAYAMIRSYGEQGRQYYAVIELTLDLVYPLLSALFFSSLTIYAFRRVFPLGSFVQKLPLLSLIVMALDYLENLSIVLMLQSYPRRLDFVAQAANLFTITKFTLSQLEMVLILIAVGGLLARVVLSRFKKSAAS